MPRKKRGGGGDAAERGESAGEAATVPAPPAGGGVVGKLCALPDALAPAAGDVSARGVHLSWELLAQLGATVGEHVEVARRGGGESVFARAWASRKLKPASIGLGRRVRAALGPDVREPPLELLVRRLRAPPARARALGLELDEGSAFAPSETLREYAHAWLDGAVLREGGAVVVPYGGRDVLLRVSSALAADAADSGGSGSAERGEEAAAQAERGAGAQHADGAAPLLVTRDTAVHLAAGRCASAAARPGAADGGVGGGVGGGAGGDGCATGRAAAGVPRRPCGLDALGGLPPEAHAALADLSISLLRPHALTALGVRPMGGCLLHGAAGVGKSALLWAMAEALEASGARALRVSAAQLLAERGPAAADGAIHALFARARAAAPAVVAIDELELLAPRRGGGGGGGAAEAEGGARAVAALLTCVDGVRGAAHHRVALLGTARAADALEPALRRPGRLDVEVCVRAPGSAERAAIVRALAARGAAGAGGEGRALPEAWVGALAARTHGYVAADLHALLRELEQAAAAEGGGGGAALAEPASDRGAALLGRVLARVPPSALRESQLEMPSVRWADIGGHADTVGAVREAVEWPLRHAGAFARMGVRPPRGVLLYGPPGCSKTLTAKALATESGLNFVAVKGPELLSKWVGDSEKAVQALFERARAAAPAIIFFDEIDALAPARQHGAGGSGVGMRVLAQLLHEMDGVGGAGGERAHVVVLGATNRPDLVDAALLRPGRFDRLLYVGLPDEGARRAVLAVHTRATPLAPDVQLDAVAARTAGYSGAELAAVCREAAMCALQHSADAPHVEARHVEAALRAVQPRTPPALLQLYERYRQSARAAAQAQPGAPGAAAAAEPGAPQVDAAARAADGADGSAETAAAALSELRLS